MSVPTAKTAAQKARRAKRDRWRTNRDARDRAARQDELRVQGHAAWERLLSLLKEV